MNKQVDHKIVNPIPHFDANSGLYTVENNFTKRNHYLYHFQLNLRPEFLQGLQLKVIKLGEKNATTK